MSTAVDVHNTDAYKRNPYLVQGIDNLPLETMLAACEVEPMVYSLIHINMRSNYPELADYAVSRNTFLAKYIPRRVFTFEHLLKLADTMEGCTAVSERLETSTVWADTINGLVAKNAPDLKSLLELRDTGTKVITQAKFIYDAFQSYKLECSADVQNIPTF